MDHTTKEQETLEAIARDVRSLRYSFGISLIIIAVLLMATLPQVIQNTIYRTDRADADTMAPYTQHKDAKATGSMATSTATTTVPAPKSRY